MRIRRFERDVFNVRFRLQNRRDACELAGATIFAELTAKVAENQGRELIVGQTAKTWMMPSVDGLAAALEPHAGKQDFGEFDMRHSAASEATLVAVEGSVSASLIALSLIRHQRVTIGK